MLTPEQVADRLAISELLNRYAAAVDGRDWETLRDVFTPEAVLDYSDTRGPRGTIDELIPWLRDSLALFSFSQHLITNVLVDLDGDAAASRCLFFNPMGTARVDGRLDMLYVGGAYEDRLQRTPNGWRIVERVHRMAWMQGGATPGFAALPGEPS